MKLQSKKLYYKIKIKKKDGMKKKKVCSNFF